MYFPVSFSRNFSAARRRAISFWRSVSWGAAGSGVAMGTSSTGAAASAGASPGSDRSFSCRQRAHGRARGVGGASAAAWLTSASRAILRLHNVMVVGRCLVSRFQGSQGCLASLVRSRDAQGCLLKFESTRRDASTAL